MYILQWTQHLQAPLKSTDSTSLFRLYIYSMHLYDYIHCTHKKWKKENTVLPLGTGWHCNKFGLACKMYIICILWNFSFPTSCLLIKDVRRVDTSEKTFYKTRSCNCPRSTVGLSYCMLTSWSAVQWVLLPRFTTLWVMMTWANENLHRPLIIMLMTKCWVRV